MQRSKHLIWTPAREDEEKEEEKESSSGEEASSDSEEEQPTKSVNSINWDTRLMSIRLGDEEQEQGEETSDDEEDPVSRLQGLLLSNHVEDKVTKWN